MQHAEALPGPIWVFGAWAAGRFCSFAAALPGWVGHPSGLTWDAAAVFGVGVLAALLPVGVVASLVCRKPYALSFAKWYATWKIAALFLSMLVPLFGGSDAPFPEAGAAPIGIFRAAVRIVVWFLFLRYLERADPIDRLFPPGERRSIPWWLVVGTAGILLFG